jgi:hypothetical protein
MDSISMSVVTARFQIHISYKLCGTGIKAEPMLFSLTFQSLIVQVDKR